MEKAIRALIAEDDFATRWRMKRLIEPYICCDIAVNSSEVLLAFEISQDDGTPYDIMLIDVDLPGNTPAEIIADIRKREANRNIVRLDQIKFVAISRHDTSSRALSEILSQCEGHITRPINKGDFLGQLHSMGFLQS
jgi:CheY-like chemotaxis protein